MPSVLFVNKLKSRFQMLHLKSKPIDAAIKTWAFLKFKQLKSNKFFLIKISMFNCRFYILFSHTLMTAQFLFHILKTTSQKIGGFGDVQFSNALKGKQIIQVPFQAVAGASKSLVRVVWLACFRINSTFIQEAFVPLKPAV